MGQSLKGGPARQQLDALEADTQAAARELQLDIAQTALDAAGLVDPTPISDAAGALLSAARGDWFGAAMSVVSMLPYAGDAIGKTAKGAKLAEKIAVLEARLANNVVRGKQILANALKSDAATVRARRAADKAARIEEGLIKDCPVGGNDFGTHAPKDGWAGKPGDSLWDPAEAGYHADKIEEITSVTKGEPLRFEDGYPDFSPYALQARAADGSPVPARVEIRMTGENGPDFGAARQAMADKLGLPKFKEPAGYTWHHNPDGVTMELIPSELHNNIPHSGGATLARDPGY